MKKTIPILLLAIVISACNKKSDLVSEKSPIKHFSADRNYLTIQEMKFLSDFSLFAKDFKIVHPNSFIQTASTQSRFSLKRLFRIIGADILGAAGGGIVGGLALGAPGAIGGALVSGVASSFLAGEPAVSSLRSPATLAIDTLPFRFNYENPMEFIGNGHNEEMDNLRNAAAGTSLNHTDIYNDIQRYVALKYPAIASMPTYEQYQQMATNNTTVLLLSKPIEIGVSEIQNSLDENGTLSLFHRELFKIIFVYGMQMKDYDAIAEFFYKAESIITESQIDEMDKTILYAAFATGRASANYWFDADLGNR